MEGREFELFSKRDEFIVSGVYSGENQESVCLQRGRPGESSKVTIEIRQGEDLHNYHGQ
ncbi:hypothetical protein COLO4_37403 [Corchorus olitorius]|uniref:Uncharacterized protein n=1 Tax=Corchorus olitorius TaxID=93759 RepID=A0A1R3G205_9ROSI|nr:hypothetical protein COLO4_37403 [Corchorus olitorius]